MVAVLYKQGTDPIEELVDLTLWRVRSSTRLMTLCFLMRLTTVSQISYVCLLIVHRLPTDMNIRFLFLRYTYPISSIQQLITYDVTSFNRSTKI